MAQEGAVQAIVDVSFQWLVCGLKKDDFQTLTKYTHLQGGYGPRRQSGYRNSCIWVMIVSSIMADLYDLRHPICPFTTTDVCAILGKSLITQESLCDRVVWLRYWFLSKLPAFSLDLMIQMSLTTILPGHLERVFCCRWWEPWRICTLIRVLCSISPYLWTNVIHIWQFAITLHSDSIDLCQKCARLLNLLSFNEANVEPYVFWLLQYVLCCAVR